MNYRTEDEVRDSAKLILGFDKNEPKVKQGTGQITTFNQAQTAISLIMYLLQFLGFSYMTPYMKNPDVDSR